MTAYGDIGQNIDTFQLVENCTIIPYWLQKEGPIRIEGHLENGEVTRIGDCRRYLLAKKDPGRIFRNAVNVYFRIYDEETGEGKEPCVKLFRNGSFQITGIRTPTQMNLTANHILKLVVDTNAYTEDLPVESNITTKICMMNSDMAFPFKIDRRKLQEIVSSTTKLQTSFESTSYQGVNIKYFYHERNNENEQGVCTCEKVCKGDGDGTEHSDCRRITIAPFQTGKIIITGARSIVHLDSAAKCISDIILNNLEDVVAGKLDEPKAPKKTRILQCHSHKVVTIPMNNIMRLVNSPSN